MTRRFRISANRAASALVLCFALAAPAVADGWYGGCGMPYGHHDCHDHPGHLYGMYGPGDCPRVQGDARFAPLGGKTLGVLVSDLSNAYLDETGMGYGVSVDRVQPDSAAAKAGIRAGDQIIGFDGKPVYSTQRLRWLVHHAEPGKALEIQLIRDKEPVSVTATLKEPEPRPRCDDWPKPRHGT